jgi:hypothetical protein
LVVEQLGVQFIFEQLVLQQLGFEQLVLQQLVQFLEFTQFLRLQQHRSFGLQFFLLIIVIVIVVVILLLIMRLFKFRLVVLFEFFF